MVRVGIIGFGFMGQTHWHHYRKLGDHAKVVAVADADSRRAHGDTSGTWGNLGEGAQQVDFSDIASTTNWQDVVAMPNVDAVDVCVPTPQHPEIVMAALAAGKHVLCEKPLTRTLVEAQAIADAAKNAKSYLMPAMCMRFWPQWAWLKEAISSGRYGHVRGATFLRQGATPVGWYRNGEISGGALLDLHIHDTDFICGLFGQPKAVTSRGYRAQTGAYDHVSTQYHYDDIPLVVADGGWSFAEPFSFRMRYTVTFDSNVTADFDLARTDPLVVYDGKVAQPIACEAIDGWFGEIRYFTACIADRKRPTEVTVDDAVRAIRVIEAESRSIASQRTETV
jgi:predicted dehydrogenase